MEFSPFKTRPRQCAATTRIAADEQQKRVIHVDMHTLNARTRPQHKPKKGGGWLLATHLCGLSISCARGKQPTQRLVCVLSPYHAFSQFAAVNNDLRCLQRSKLFAPPRGLAIALAAARPRRSAGRLRKSLAEPSSASENIASASETGWGKLGVPLAPAAFASRASDRKTFGSGACQVIPDDTWGFGFTRLHYRVLGTRTTGATFNLLLVCLFVVSVDVHGSWEEWWTYDGISGESHSCALQYTSSLLINLNDRTLCLFRNPRRAGISAQL
jgi:hypothetical protein